MQYMGLKIEHSKSCKTKTPKVGELRLYYNFGVLRVYQVDSWHSHCLGQDTSLQFIVVVAMATRPVFGTFSKSWKTKTPKSWKTKTLL